MQAFKITSAHQPGLMGGVYRVLKTEHNFCGGPGFDCFLTLDTFHGERVVAAAYGEWTNEAPRRSPREQADHEAREAFRALPRAEQLRQTIESYDDLLAEWDDAELRRVRDKHAAELARLLSA